MSELINVISKMKNLISLNPATESDVKTIEQELGLALSKEYKEYLLQFGAILADNVELTGFAKAKTRNIVSVTKQEWILNNMVPHDMYVVEILGMDGIIIWQDSRGYIYETIPTKEPKMIFTSLTDYLKSR